MSVPFLSQNPLRVLQVLDLEPYKISPAPGVGLLQLVLLASLDIGRLDAVQFFAE